MGSLLGGSQKTTTKSEPWKPQGDALKGIFDSAGSIYNRQRDTPFYQGNLYAGMDTMSADAINQMGRDLTGQGAENASAISGAGRAMLDRWSSSPNALDALMRASATDPTGSNIAAAMQYANNPATDGMIDAASRDVVRNLTEGDLPNINRAAAGSGNMNSSRAGVASAVAERGAADRVSDISAAIRGDQFNRGLSLAENARQANMSGLDRATQLGNQTFGLGIDGISSGNTFNLGNLEALINAGGLRQRDAQGQIDADFARWQGEDGRATDLLNRYYSIIGANNWGGTQTSRTKSNPGILGAALGIGSMIGGFGGFGAGGLGGLFSGGGPRPISTGMKG